MNGAEMPAMPVPGLSDDPDFNGLTKRERFCVAMGVPGTGDAELDDIIRAGVRQKHAALAMQSIIASKHEKIRWWPDDIKQQAFAVSAVAYADALRAELERTGGES